jgi:hypothetical protein
MCAERALVAASENLEKYSGAVSLLRGKGTARLFEKISISG